MQHIRGLVDGIVDGTVTAPVTPYPLADVAAAWSEQTLGRRVVIAGE